MSRLQGLDALRGIAATLVLVAHILGQLRGDGSSAARTMLLAFDFGAFGVLLFFLISGFVIPFSLQRGIRAFAISRAARLLPALWVSIAFCFLLGEQMQSGLQLVGNALMIAPLLGQTRFSGPYWTLTWELGFYCLVALAFALRLIRRPQFFGMASVVAACVALRHPPAIYLIYMFVGGLSRMVFLEKEDAAKPWLFGALVSLVAVLLLWAVVGDLTAPMLFAYTAPFVVFFAWRDRLSHPILLWLGAISYSLYLFNLPLIEGLARLDLPLTLFLALGLALPLLLAAIVYRFVERPGMALGKRIISARLSNCAAEPGTRSTVGG